MISAPPAAAPSPNPNCRRVSIDPSPFSPLAGSYGIGPVAATAAAVSIGCKRFGLPARAAPLHMAGMSIDTAPIGQSHARETKAFIAISGLCKTFATLQGDRIE